MTKVDIFSGFLGAGKTTLIKKLIKEAYSGEKLVLIENEFGQIGIDGGFLTEAGINVTEMNSGCICCSLVGDFGEALKKVQEEYAPDRIIIEPSGVGKLSDVIGAVEKAGIADLSLNVFCAVIDATKCKMYMKNFSEFYENQIEHASAIVLSRTATIKKEKLDECIDIIKSVNDKAPIITTDWEELDGKTILKAIEGLSGIKSEIEKMMEEHHHHHHECDDPDCDCHEHHHHHDHDHECDDPDCDCHEHHHHHDHDHECDDPDCDCHEHHHHHDHDHECDDPDCDCHEHHHHHDHHGHHHADDVFTSWGIETAEKYTAEFIEYCLDEMMTGRFGMVLRAKGIVPSEDGKWIHFDYVPGEKNVRYGTADFTGKLCVIGTGLDKHALKHLFERG